MIKLLPLSEQVVVVIGASSGIGRATALRAAERGARVVVSARNKEALDSLVEDIRASGGRAQSVVADVTFPDDMERVAEEAIAVFGQIDSWVHSTGIAMFARFTKTEPDDFRRVVEVNLLGQVHGARAAIPHLRDRGGALIHVTSAEARQSLPMQTAYGASKHGVDAFVKALRVELRQEGAPIAVTQVLPAAINTPLFTNARSRLGVEPIAPPPLYTAESVADVILYACEHPSRDLYAGGIGRLLVLSGRISQRGLETVMTRVGVRSLLTNRTETTQDNFDGPRTDTVGVGGPHPRITFRHSTYNWVQQHSPMRKLAERLSGPRSFRDKFEPSDERKPRHGTKRSLFRP